MHGFSYNNFSYLDGMRYRGRTLGFSLDSDSRLLSAQMAWSDEEARFYQVSLHHAQISTAENNLGNSVTTAPVTVNMAELRFTMPLPWLNLDLAARIQDDQPRPRRGTAAALEAQIRFSL